MYGYADVANVTGYAMYLLSRMVAADSGMTEQLVLMLG
jgi:hypothetical protein